MLYYPSTRHRTDWISWNELLMRFCSRKGEVLQYHHVKQ
jgi:hypothetical protein